MSTAVVTHEVSGELLSGSDQTSKQQNVEKENLLPPIVQPATPSHPVSRGRLFRKGSVVVPFQTAREPLRFTDGISKDMYDDSFLGGFVNGKQEDTLRGRGAGCTLKSYSRCAKVQTSPRSSKRRLSKRLSTANLVTKSAEGQSGSPKHKDYREYFQHFHRLAEGLEPLKAHTASQSPRGAAHTRCKGLRHQEGEFNDKRHSTTDSVFSSDAVSPREVSANRAGVESMRMPQFKFVDGPPVGEKSDVQDLRGACESMRMLTFGYIGNEDWNPKEKHLIVEQRRGTSTEMHSLCDLWVQLNQDGGDDIDLMEFLDFFAQHKHHILSKRCVRYLASRGAFGSSDPEDLDKGSKQRLTGKCSMEDLMCLIWPRATEADLATMLEIFAVHKLSSMSVPPLRLLPARRRQELIENFRHMDRNGVGSVTYEDLVNQGLVDAKMARELRDQYDLDGIGSLNCQEFLEMLCPYGYRAHENVKCAIDKSGQGLSFVECTRGGLSFAGWLFDKDLAAFRARFDLELNS